MHLPDPAQHRRTYRRDELSEADLAPTWHAQLARWYAEASAPGSGLVEPNAVVLATADLRARPSARTVLLKAFDARGLVVFTNLTSRKGREALANPYASLVFPWVPMERQVIAHGPVQQVAREETEAYFRSRPRASQIGAWVSHQSRVLTDRAELVAREAELTARFAGGEVPVPEFWGGLRLVPETVEFWQGRPSRLHDRLRYDVARGVVERLAP